jgi:hypothetical protein
MSKVQLSGNASGTGIFTIASPNSNTDRTLTLPDNTGTLVTTASTGTVTQAMLASNVSTNGPAFNAYRSTNQGVSSATWTKIQFNAEDFDTAGAYDTSTNYRFQPLVAGYYSIQFAMACYTGAFTAVMARLYKNGSGTNIQAYNYGGTNALDDWGVGASTMIYMNGSTDYLEVYGFSFGGSAEFNSQGTWFSGFLARTA